MLLFAKFSPAARPKQSFRPAAQLKQSFRPPFSKGGGFQRQRLWPPSADGGTLYPLGVFGGLGAFTRERPPRPLPIPLAQAVGASPMGRWRAAPEGALAICLPAPSVGIPRWQHQ